MLKGLEPVLPHIQNIAIAAALLLVAYMLTIPLRHRYGSPYSTEPIQRSGRQFAGALLSYLAFSILILVPSIPIIYGLNRAEAFEDWSPYHKAWLSFWSIHLVVRLAEGLFVEIFVQLGRTSPMTRLSRGLLHLAIMLGVAFMLIKYQLGFNISVLLTSTAIVTGVIGFAMQGVLGNLLAGMSLHASRSISVGDYIEVDDRIGKVILVNWRETRLRTLGGHMVIIPNAKLADLTIRNFSSPTSLRRHEVAVAASYGDKPGDVIDALIEAAQCVPMVEKHPAPDAYVTGFKDFCIEYVLRFWSKQYEQYIMIEGHVMRMIWYKFSRRGIEIPFPMSGRMLGNFMEAVHAQQFEMPLASEIERCVDDLLRSDFGCKLMADAEGVCLLSRDELKAVARSVKRTYFTQGEVLMHQNDTGESFYVLIRGKLHGSISNPDVSRNVEFDLGTGTLFGEMSLLTGLPRSATITAVTHCEVLEFDRTAFTCLLSIQEEILHVLSDLAAARTAENAEALEKLRAIADIPSDLTRDGIMNRLKRMLGQWRGRQAK
ncbi:MAG: mechanosensitive ion channel [Sedimentisphaerales bacterium]|nr:mechanosensitive ion channel [Sedimentisphaerales bacterium]